MTKEEVLSKIRHKYTFFQSPHKSDRVDIPEEIWQKIDWTEEEIRINAALPHHMWNRRQDDRPWPLSRQFRGENAIGPRAAALNVPEKFAHTPPKLVKGRGISRWMAIGDQSVLEIPIFDRYKTVWTMDTIPIHLRAIEKNPAHVNFNKVINVTKLYLLNNYGPSSLQKFSNRSFLLREPYHISYHKMLKRREKFGVSRDKTGADIVAFSRYGDRWDSLDNYFVKKAFYVGLAWN